MPKRHRLLIALLVTSLVAMMATMAFAKHRGRAGTPQCPVDCGIQLDHGPWVSATDRVITAVCLSAGKERFSFTQDGTDGCYTVTGLGTANVTVTDGGKHGHCKDISSVVFYYECLFPA